MKLKEQIGEKEKIYQEKEEKIKAYNKLMEEKIKLEEEKIGIHNVMELDMQKSLKKSKRKIRGYLNYYTSVMSRRGLIYN